MLSRTTELGGVVYSLFLLFVPWEAATPPASRDRSPVEHADGSRHGRPASIRHLRLLAWSLARVPAWAPQGEGC